MGPILTDGNHLIAAAQRAGLTDLPVARFESTPEGRRAATRSIVALERAKEMGTYDAEPRPYADRAPRIGDVVVLDDGREGEVRRVYADGRSIKFSFVERNGSITREKVDKGSVAKITSAAPEPLAPGERRAPNLSGIQHLPEDVRQELTDAVQEMTSLYDVPFAGVTAREEDWHGGDSFANGGTTIIFNPKIADPEFRERHTSGFGYVLASNMREALIHEFGHTIDRQYLADEGKRNRKGTTPLHRMFAEVTADHQQVVSGEMNPDFDPSDPDSTLWLYPDGTSADLAERVSSYASTNDVGESVAESFLAGHLGRTNRYTLAVRAAFAPYVRQEEGAAVKPVPGPDPSAMTPTAITTELRVLGESLNGTDPSSRAWGPIAARRDLLANELMTRAGFNPATGRKALAEGTLPSVQMTAQEMLQALIEGKHDGRFDPAKHPRDDHGRWAHTPGGKRVKIPKGYHVGGQVEVHLPDFSREGAARGYPMKWHRATVENITADESGRTLNVQMRIHKDGRPHVQIIGIRGGNPRLRPVSDAAPEAASTSGALGVQEHTDAEYRDAHALLVSVLGDGGIPKQGRKEGTGTLDDPIAVGDDLGRAAQLLAEGKHVRLDQTEQVATLVDKLRELVEHARARGEKAPVYDLCRVSVPGTNLFCKQSKGIPRIKMPQFRGNDVRPGSPAEAFRGPDGGQANIEQPFREALAAMGIPTRLTTVPASHLRASQNELDGGKVSMIAAGIEAGRIKDMPIFVTRDNYIIDGHHRWAGKVAVDTRDGRLGDVMMPVEVVDLDIGAALDYANAFMKVMGLASQSVDDPGSGKAPTPSRKVISLTVPSLPSDFREQMNKALAGGATTPSVRRRAFLAVKDIAPSAALLDGEGSGEEVPVEAAVAASPVPPRRSRIADHLAAVYAQTPRHHVVRAIDAAYARAGDPPAEDAKEA